MLLRSSRSYRTVEVRQTCKKITVLSPGYSSSLQVSFQFQQLTLLYIIISHLGAFFSTPLILLN